MTVAAVVLAGSPASALAQADGTPAVRRIADAAWAGGATPVVVASADPDGEVGAALANAEVTLAPPAAPGSGPRSDLAEAVLGARALVTGTEAALVWPARFAWVDAETVTTLIAAHGEDRGAVLRPAWGGRAGYPVLLPLVHLDALALDPRGEWAGGEGLHPEDDIEGAIEGLWAMLPARLVETGDPGTVLDVSIPRSRLPPYDGPPEPADGRPREWGAPAAEEADEAPVPGPPRLSPADEAP